MTPKPIALVLDDADLTHRLTARFDEDRVVLVRRETISRRRVLPLVPVYDTIIDEQARFTDRDLLVAIDVVSRPLEPRLRFLGIPLAYREEVRELRAKGETSLRVAVGHSYQGRLHAFFCRCYAALYDGG